jgi:hypothetical protein
MLSNALYKTKKDKLFTVLETEKFSTGTMFHSVCLLVGWLVRWLVCIQNLIQTANNSVVSTALQDTRAEINFPFESFNIHRHVR